MRLKDLRLNKGKSGALLKKVGLAFFVLFILFDLCVLFPRDNKYLDELFISWVCTKEPEIDSIEVPEIAVSCSDQASEPQCCEESCGGGPWPQRITIRQMQGDQETKHLPFTTNYTSLELFFSPNYRPDHMMPFVELIGHRFNNNTYATNVEVGCRYIPSSDSFLDDCCNDCCGRFCEILGFNLSYDWRQGCIGYYQQIGAGVEILGRNWDIKGNAYVPFGQKRRIRTSIYDDYIGDYFISREDIESVSYSFNAELGFYLINACDFSLHLAGGPYYLAHANSCEPTVGGEVRLRPQYKDYLALDLGWRYDNLFKTIWQLEISVTLPLYQIAKRNKCPCGLYDRQIYQPVDRFEVMPLNKRTCWDSNF